MAPVEKRQTNSWIKNYSNHSNLNGWYSVFLCLTFIENRLGAISQSKTYLIDEFSIIMCFIKKNDLT